ncbi:neural cell adhesion molecule 1-like [Carcharodon carcharias]|uniref:neural cell adhesion molecule 1-like n=1 Tax=Carcharodon carcharias TaxID=13397 RepID=UPI001B7DCD4B|nr:neural cell adhesion molecule 1-like [Carcharodon carcharias]
MKLQLCICSCLLLLGGARAGRGRLSIEPSSGIIYLNKDQVFNCKVEGSDAFEFHWKFPNDEVIVKDEHERFQLSESEYDRQLHIVNAKASDGGDYMCQAEDDNGVEMKKKISIKVIQKVTFQNVKTELEFAEGSQAVLGCDVTGIPQPTVSWTRDGQDIPLSRNGRFQKLLNNHLQISSIEPSDAGMYECVGKIMERNEQNSTTIAVTVNYAPRLLPPPTRTMHTWLGNPVNVSCRFQSYPGAAVTWTHNGTDLGELANTFPAGNREESVSTLEVMVTSEADLGEYRCTANNSLGSVSGSIRVQQGDLPSAPQNLTAVSLSTTVRVSLSRPESDGGIPILGYQVEWRISGTTDWSSQTAETESPLLTGLEPYTPYQFRAAALNGRGLGEYSPPLTARTLSLREPDRPKLKARNDSEGNTYRIYFDDPESDGSPVLKHNIKYKEEHSVEWISDSVNGTDSYLLENLTWATHYFVQVEAENQMGPSQPTFLNFTTPEQPLPATSANLATGQKAKIGMGGIVGIIMMIFLVLLLAVDVTCYYTRRCGILMCIAVNVLGKQEPAVKRLEQEMGVTVVSAEPKGNLCEIHTGGPLQKYNKAKHAGTSNDKMPLTKSETLPVSDKTPNQP